MNDIDQTALEIARAFIPVDVVGQQSANLQVAIIEAIKKHANPKTLADVQPGGRVRLGDGLPPLPPKDIVDTHLPTGVRIYGYTAEQMREYARATLSARPSPGGQVDRWVTQTKFYDPNQAPEVCTGNCTEAALASLFGMRLDEVPSMQGLAGSEYWEALEAFVRSRGFALSMHPPSHYPAGLYLADGPSERGCGHFVVMRDGEMVHDPHPSRVGLLNVERVWSLTALDPAALSAPPAQAVDLGQSIPSELAPVAAALKRFGDCAEDSGSEGCDIGRDWFDALTTIGLLSRTQRSPAVWTMTAEGERLLALIDSQAVGNG